jgi:hypothetical protein
MDHFLDLLLVHGLILAIFAIGERIAHWLAQKKMPQFLNRRSLLMAVYVGRFFDFFLSYARLELLAILSFSLLLNLLGALVLANCQALVFLDTAGTALSAFILGPWWGAIVGLGTNCLGSTLFGFDSRYHDFSIVNVTLGIAWGYYGILRRTEISSLHLVNYKKLIRFILYAGGVGLIVSSLSASWVLLTILNKDPKVPNTFHMDLYNFLCSRFALPSGQDNFWLFLLAELVFNAPDKLISLAICIIILVLIFPVSRMFETVGPTINFIKSSSGSHLLFIALYVIYILVARHPEMSVLLLSIPLIICAISYLTMAKFVPNSLQEYDTLAVFLRGMRGRSTLWIVRRRLLRFSAYAILAVVYYYAVIWSSGMHLEIWNDKVVIAWERDLRIVITALAFLFLASPSLIFLSKDTKLWEDGLRKRLDEKASALSSEGRCKVCDYDLTGNTSDCCPECRTTT